MTLEEDDEARFALRKAITFPPEPRICTFCGDFTRVHTRSISTICVKCVAQCAMYHLQKPHPHFKARNTITREVLSTLGTKLTEVIPEPKKKRAPRKLKKEK